MSHKQCLPFLGFMIILHPTFLSPSDRNPFLNWMWKFSINEAGVWCVFVKLNGQKVGSQNHSRTPFICKLWWPEHVKVDTFPCRYVFPVLPEFKTTFSNREQEKLSHLWDYLWKAAFLLQGKECHQERPSAHLSKPCAKKVSLWSLGWCSLSEQALKAAGKAISG